MSAQALNAFRCSNCLLRCNQLLSGARYSLYLQSTLFNAICKNAKAQAANFPFCTIEPNIGVVAVPDTRLQVSHMWVMFYSKWTRVSTYKIHTHHKRDRSCMQILSDLSKSKKLVPTSIEFVDIAGLVKGASTGEGLGNKFLANIRECDSIVQVSSHSSALQCSDYSSVTDTT